MYVCMNVALFVCKIYILGNKFLSVLFCAKNVFFSCDAFIKIMCYLFALMSNFLNRGELSRFMQDTKADMMEK